MTIKDRLGPSPDDRGKAPVKERLGRLNESRAHCQAGDRHPKQWKRMYNGKNPASDRIGLRVGAHGGQ